jgi:hypothetical protein
MCEDDHGYQASEIVPLPKTIKMNFTILLFLGEYFWHPTPSMKLEE